MQKPCPQVVHRLRKHESLGFVTRMGSNVIKRACTHSRCKTCLFVLWFYGMSRLIRFGQMVLAADSLLILPANLDHPLCVLSNYFIDIGPYILCALLHLCTDKPTLPSELNPLIIGGKSKLLLNTYCMNLQINVNVILS